MGINNPHQVEETIISDQFPSHGTEAENQDSRLLTATELGMDLGFVEDDDEHQN